MTEFSSDDGALKYIRYTFIVSRPEAAEHSQRGDAVALFLGLLRATAYTWRVAAP
jgi:hypothetical protein